MDPKKFDPSRFASRDITRHFIFRSHCCSPFSIPSIPLSPALPTCKIPHLKCKSRFLLPLPRAVGACEAKSRTTTKRFNGCHGSATPVWSRWLLHYIYTVFSLFSTDPPLPGYLARGRDSVECFSYRTVNGRLYLHPQSWLAAGAAPLTDKPINWAGRQRASRGHRQVFPG